MLGASVVVIDDEAKRAAYPEEVLFQNGSYLALKLGRPGRAVLESGGERLELEAEVDEPSRLVFALPRGGERPTVRDAWFPGWEAEVEGETIPLLDAEGLRAIALRGSEHRVELRYRTGSFRLGLGGSLMSLGVLGSADVPAGTTGDSHRPGAGCCMSVFASTFHWRSATP